MCAAGSARGLNFQANYTFSKVLADADGNDQSASSRFWI